MRTVHTTLAGAPEKRIPGFEHDIPGWLSAST
jgi:hypothetical protein